MNGKYLRWMEVELDGSVSITNTSYSLGFDNFMSKIP
jgi:hypothetical protein